MGMIKNVKISREPIDGPLSNLANAGLDAATTHKDFNNEVGIIVITSDGKHVANATANLTIGTIMRLLELTIDAYLKYIEENN